MSDKELVKFYQDLVETQRGIIENLTSVLSATNDTIEALNNELVKATLK